MQSIQKDDDSAVAEILLVEDLEDTVVGLTHDLEYRGARVHHASSSHVAQLMLSEGPFDAVLVDLNIPAEPGSDPSPENGRHLVRLLCEGKFPENAGVGVLIITAQKVDLRTDEFADCEGYLGVKSKIGDSRWLIQSLRGLGLAEHEELDADLYQPRRERIQLVVRSATEGYVTVDAPGLGIGTWRMPMSAFSEGLRRRIRSRPKPMALWAVGNVDASSEVDLLPREFVMSEDPVDQSVPPWRRE